VARRIVGVLAEGARLAHRLIRPSGFTVAFLGIDGGGKSSVVRHMIENLAPAFPRTRYHHFKPNLLGRPPQPASTLVIHPTGVARGISMLGMARLAYYLLDYSIGYACKVWPQRLRSALVIFDRHYYDLGIDPIRLRRRIPMALARGFAMFVPKPDLVIVVNTPAETARSRKAGVPPLEEAARQQAAYLALARALPNACIVDGSKQVTQLAHEVGRLILDRMSARTAGRLGWRRA
jgi:thymidylate kinase